MAVVPRAIPVTVPSVPMVPIAVLALLHAPNGVISDNIGEDWFRHTFRLPVMAAGSGFTVTVVKFLQPVIGSV